MNAFLFRMIEMDNSTNLLEGFDLDFSKPKPKETKTTLPHISPLGENEKQVRKLFLTDKSYQEIRPNAIWR